MIIRATTARLLFFIHLKNEQLSGGIIAVFFYFARTDPLPAERAVVFVRCSLNLFTVAPGCLNTAIGKVT